MRKRGGKNSNQTKEKKIQKISNAWVFTGIRVVFKKCMGIPDSRIPMHFKTWESVFDFLLLKQQKEK